MRMRLIDSKRLQRLYDQVSDNRKNCAFEDLERLLLAVGFTARYTSGSHVIFKLGTTTLSVPKRKPLKRTYFEQALDVIKTREVTAYAFTAPHTPSKGSA